MKLSNVHLGSVYLEETTSKYYETCRFPDKTARGYFDRQVETIRGMKKSTIEKGHGVISDPIMVWQPDASKNQYVIVSPVELWHAIYKHTLPNQNSRLISPQDIRWTNVFMMEGNEQDVKNLILSFPHITQPIDIVKIAQSRGYRKIDMYNQNKGNIDMNTNDKSEAKTACDNTAPESMPNETIKEESNTTPRQTPTLSSLVVLEELENLFPPLDEEAYQLLKNDILEFRECLQPIVIWGSRNTILDGHNRVRACLEIKREKGIEIKCRIRPLEFEDISDAIVWMIRNQVHRRSLSEYDRCQMILRYREEITKRNNDKKKLNLKQYQNPSMPPADTPDVPTEKHILCKSEEQQEPVEDKPNIFEGMPEPSREKLRKVKKIQESGLDSVIKDVRSGKTTINAAFTKIQEKQKENDDSQPEDEQHKVEPNVLEPLKLKIGNELIRLSPGVFPGCSILVVKLTKGASALGEMLKEHGFEFEDTITHEKAFVVLMSDKTYYDRLNVKQSTDANTKEEKKSDT